MHERTNAKQHNTHAALNPLHCDSLYTKVSMDNALLPEEQKKKSIARNSFVA